MPPTRSYKDFSEYSDEDKKNTGVYIPKEVLYDFDDIITEMERSEKYDDVSRSRQVTELMIEFIKQGGPEGKSMAAVPLAD